MCLQRPVVPRTKALLPFYCLKWWEQRQELNAGGLQVFQQSCTWSILLFGNCTEPVTVTCSMGQLGVTNLAKNSCSLTAFQSLWVQQVKDVPLKLHKQIIRHRPGQMKSLSKKWLILGMVVCAYKHRRRIWWSWQFWNMLFVIKTTKLMRHNVLPAAQPDVFFLSHNYMLLWQNIFATMIFLSTYLSTYHGGVDQQFAKTRL